MSRKGEAFEIFSQNWQRDPKVADLDYLDLAFPEPRYLSFANISVPCFHRIQSSDNHSLGKTRSTDPLLNSFTDFHLTGLYNQSIFYDRFKIFADYCAEKLEGLEAKLQRLEQESAVPKEVEEETLQALRKLGERITKLEDQQLS